jgi:hypothetical protein
MKTNMFSCYCPRPCSASIRKTSRRSKTMGVLRHVILLGSSMILGCVCFFFLGGGGFPSSHGMCVCLSVCMCVFLRAGSTSVCSHKRVCNCVCNVCVSTSLCYTHKRVCGIRWCSDTCVCVCVVACVFEYW